MKRLLRTGLLLVACASAPGCALLAKLRGPTPEAVPAPPTAPAATDPLAEQTPPVLDSARAEVIPDGTAATDDVGDSDEGAEESDDDEGAIEEAESHEGEENVSPDLRYTRDISDEALQEMWKGAPEKLGSVSFGFVDEGRLINSERFPEDSESNAWLLVSPDLAWGTRETIDYVISAIRKVREQYPNAPPLRVNQISTREGGYLRPHKSHQNGRDVDLGFYYPTVNPIRTRAREKVIDVAKNWALLKALAISADVQFVLVDRRVSKVIYDYAVKAGENRTWLNTLFHSGKGSMVRHARRHRDHFHVRFYNARAQELGRRLAPLLAQRPEQNVAMHRVRRGDSLGLIARKYGSSVAGLRKANRLKTNFLRLSQVLKVPLRGPCTHCPIPPPLLVPQRRLPPGMVIEDLQRPTVAVSISNPLAPPLKVSPAPATLSNNTAAATPASVAPAAAEKAGDMAPTPKSEPGSSTGIQTSPQPNGPAATPQAESAASSAGSRN